MRREAGEGGGGGLLGTGVSQGTSEKGRRKQRVNQCPPEKKKSPTTVPNIDTNLARSGRLKCKPLSNREPPSNNRLLYITDSSHLAYGQGIVVTFHTTP